MLNSFGISDIYENSFRINIYTLTPFRMFGLIDVDIDFFYGKEKVSLAYYRSSGTNNGKMKGLWYPIVGIKIVDGYFVEFSNFINYVLTKTTLYGKATKGWLAKSLFFNSSSIENGLINGFSNGTYHYDLLYLGKKLRQQYNNNKYYMLKNLDSNYLNQTLLQNIIYNGNIKSQRTNYENFIEDIFIQVANLYV